MTLREICPGNTRLAAKADIGGADVKLRSSGCSHKPRNPAKPVAAE